MTFSTLLSSCMIPDQESTKRQSLPSLGAIRQKKTGFAPPSSILRYQQPHTHQSYVFSTFEKTILHVPRWLAAGGGSPAFPLFFPRNNNNNGGGGDCCCCRCCRSSFCCPPPMLPKSEEELTGLGQVHCLVRQCCCSPPGLGGGGGGGGSLSDGCSMRESPPLLLLLLFPPSAATVVMAVDGSLVWGYAKGGRHRTNGGGGNERGSNWTWREERC